MSKQFKPETSVIVLIDYQVGTMQLIKTMPSALSLANGVALAKTATLLGIPLIMTTSQEDRTQGPVPLELQEAAPEAFRSRIKRVGIVNAWNDANLVATIKATGRKQLIMAGITTDICLVYPTISAVQAGYEVQAVLDASGSPFQISEDAARSRMEKEGVTLTATNTLMAELAQDWASPGGSKLVAMLFAMLPKIQAEAVSA